MAQVQGPLFSLTATGQFRGLEFRTGGGKTIVASPKDIQAERRPAQVTQNNRFRVALNAWNNLSEPDKADWGVSANGTGMSGYKLFISEYFTQNIQPPGIPQRP